MIYNAGFSELSQLVQLETLDITGTGSWELNLGNIPSLSKLESLTDFRMARCPMNIAGQDLDSFFGTLSNLRSLDYSQPTCEPFS